MSAPSESAASPSPCACTNISLMQLFHELKQKFPGVPDHVVSNTIELYCHDKQACETHLHTEAKASLTHAYHASSSAAARQLHELKLNPPSKCRNQPLVKHEAPTPTPVTSTACQEPQTAVISTLTHTSEHTSDKKPNTDANQNVVVPECDESERKTNNTSPVTVINIDNCHAKYSVESPSDLELTNETLKEDKASISQEGVVEQPESTNYRILKSNKIKTNLHERLEKGKEKKTIKKEELLKEIPTEEVLIEAPKEGLKEAPQEKQEKPTRPNTLNFIKPNPDVAFKPTLKEPEIENCRTISPAPIKNETQSPKQPYRTERSYPVNVSVNVNCHMDLSRGYDPWLEDYDSPRAITSVNLTVCTPTSNMASPVRESREDDGFEGHVTVTVSPSTTRPPRRPAPPPPRLTRLESPRPTRAAPEPPGSTNERSLIERQKERLGRLATALAQERSRLAQLTRETHILAAPPPPRAAALRLREYVEKLRDQCDTLAKRLEMGGADTLQDDSGNFYSNIYTGQRPPASWQCHMCTFRNHPLLDKCEECDMPRIFVGTSPARTHDSGFGSFRDRNRKPLNEQTQLEVNNLVDEVRALPKLNC